MAKNSSKHSRKLSPESQAALKKYRESLAGKQNQDSRPSEHNSTRRTVNQKTNQIFKKGGQ